MDEGKIIEAVARAFAALDGLPEAAFLAHDESLRCQYRVRAFSAWDAAKAALAEEGIVIAKKQGPRPKETFAEEVARLQREIGQRQLRLQYLVCGDPGIMVTFPTAAAPDQR